MPGLSHKSFLCLLIVALIGLPASLRAAPATQPVVTDLLLASSGSGRTSWLALVSPPTGERPATTSLWKRSGSDAPWRIVGDIPSPVSRLLGVNDALVALLSDGSWQYVGLSTGAPLPQESRILTFAGDGESLYALARTLAPTTLPATRNSSPVPPGLGIFKLERGEWQYELSLPPEAQGDGDFPMALGIVKGSLVVAKADRQLRLWRYDAGQWQASSLPLSRPVARLRVFESAGRLAVWAAAAGELGEIHFPGRSHTLLPLESAAEAADVCESDGYLRILYARNGEIYRRRFDPGTHQEKAAAEKLSLPRLGEPPQWLRWTQGVMFGILVVILTSTLFRRKERLTLKLDFRKVRIASLGRRLAAGLLDAIPLLLGAAWIGSRYPNLEMQDVSTNPDLVVAVFIISGIYLVYVTLFEMLLGRSLGKVAAGLRIVRFDGTPAGRWQLFLRNFLRVIDLWMGVTLILTIILPLRQRLGDVAAGTIVIMDAPAQEESE